MKRDDNWRFNLAILLVVLSGIFYLLHYLIFKDRYYIFYYPLLDIAFLPIQVLLVTIGVDQILNAREKKSLLQKLNMVIGTFNSEVGSDLLRLFLQFDKSPENLSRLASIDKDWTDQKFSRAFHELRSLTYNIDSRRGDLDALKKLLMTKRNFMLRLLENPNLLEHERFTELLWAVFHLTEELTHRPQTLQLPETDSAHLSGDIQRAYGLLVVEWLVYMQHLKNDYPYLFSLALRTTPFDTSASVIITHG
ncbi:MAG: hypothetical protein WC975_05660 [Phycisphaerae bacterium]